MYERKNPSQPRVDVALFGAAAFKYYVEKIKLAIRMQEITVKYEEKRIRYIKADDGMDEKKAEIRRMNNENKLKEARAAIEALRAFHHEVDMCWDDINNRILGFVRFFPPIVLNDGPNKYTQDLVLIEIDANFSDNSIDLGA